MYEMKTYDFPRLVLGRLDAAVGESNRGLIGLEIDAKIYGVSW